MWNAVLTGALALVCGFAVYAAARRARRGGGCCGEREPAPRRTSRARAGGSFPFEVRMRIGGMVCERCARRTEDALNALEGVRASVRTGGSEAVVRLRAEPDEQALRQAVRDAGYAVLEYERVR